MSTILFVHGAMQSGASQSELGELLASEFKVHLMDRRRGDSELDDVLAEIDRTGAKRIFGVSSGAILCARAALMRPDLERVALFEPPLFPANGLDPDLLADFDASVARGDLPRTMAIGMRLAEMGPPWMFRLPIGLLAWASKRMLRSKPQLEPLARGLPADFKIVRENQGRLSDFAAISVPTLIISGTATRPYLRNASTELARVIPNAKHVELRGLFHAATQNRAEYGRPDLVAPVLLDFFRT